MSILLNDNLDVAVAKPTDNRYGPYSSTSAALVDIPPFKRYIGLVIGILSGGAVTDYWFQSGINDGDLVEKTSASSPGSVTLSVYVSSFVSDGGSSYSPILGYSDNTAAKYDVSVGGVLQDPTRSYTISADNGGTVIFPVSVPINLNIFVKTISV